MLAGWLLDHGPGPPKVIEVQGELSALLGELATGSATPQRQRAAGVIEVAITTWPRSWLRERRAGVVGRPRSS